MKKFTLIIFCITIAFNCLAQNIGIGTTTPDNSAALDISSNSKGLLLPRLTTAERNAIINPAKGLMVYTTTDSSFYMYDGAWQKIILADKVWSTKGNIGTDTATHFIGNTDNKPIVFKVANEQRMVLDSVGRLQIKSLENNFFIGEGAGINTIPTGTSLQGRYNHFIGYKSGFINTTGFNNYFSGHQAGYNNTNGFSNVFIGLNSGYNNTNGFFNQFIGEAAGFTNINGKFNQFIGYKAGYSNTSASDNQFIGINAGYTNTTGNENLFIGQNAGYNNTIGYNNSFIGLNTGYNNTTGYNNLFFGKTAGTVNGSGNNNTLVGHNSNLGQPNLSNAGAFGYNAKVNTSNSIVLGGTGADAVNVGIGTGAPAYKLDVVGRMRLAGGGTNFTSAGIWFNNINNSSTPAFVGMFDNNNIGIYGTTSQWSMLVDATNGNMGLGILPTSTLKLIVNGNVGAVTYLNLSDARYKKNILPIQNALATLSQLHAKTYNWNQTDFPKNNFDDKLQMGFIAQEVEKVLPAIVSTDADGYKAVNYIQVIPLLVQGMQEQQIKINEQEERTNKLEKELADIKKMLLQKIN